MVLIVLFFAYVSRLDKQRILIAIVAARGRKVVSLEMLKRPYKMMY